MKRHHDEPMTAEERALAAQLHRLPPHGEPAPDLDARILAMARTANGGRRPAPWYRGLPGYASAAAVCVLAAGLAWQMWPAHVQRGERVAVAPVPPPPKPVAEVLPAPPQQIAANAAADPGIADKSVADAAAPARVIAPPQPPRPAPPIPPTPQPAIVSSAKDAPNDSAPEPTVYGRTVAAPPPAPPAPPAPPPPPSVQAMDAAPAAASAEGTVKPREQPKPASAPVTVNARAKASADTENGYDARPPATVQDSSVRNDWLKRIRELMAQGDRDGARSSLQEYKTRYPDATIPADLQPLLATSPAKTP